MNTFDEYVKLYEAIKKTSLYDYRGGTEPSHEEITDEQAEIQIAKDLAAKFKSYKKSFRPNMKFNSIDDLAKHVDGVLLNFSKDWANFANNNDRLLGLRLYVSFKKILKAFQKASMEAYSIIRMINSFVVQQSNAEVEWEKNKATLTDEMLKYYKRLPAAKQSKTFLKMLVNLEDMDRCIPYDANMSKVGKPRF